MRWLFILATGPQNGFIQLARQRNNHLTGMLTSPCSKLKAIDTFPRQQVTSPCPIKRSNSLRIWLAFGVGATGCTPVVVLVWIAQDCWEPRSLLLAMVIGHFVAKTCLALGDHQIDNVNGATTIRVSRAIQLLNSKPWGQLPSPERGIQNHEKLRISSLVRALLFCISGPSPDSADERSVVPTVTRRVKAPRTSSLESGAANGPPAWRGVRFGFQYISDSRGTSRVSRRTFCKLEQVSRNGLISICALPLSRSL